MQTIGVRQLKAELSRVLRDVQRGDRYLITDRGRVVAELAQPGAIGGPERSASEQALADLIRSGQLRVAEVPPGGYGALPDPGGEPMPDGTAAAILDWLREDRGPLR